MIRRTNDFLGRFAGMPYDFRRPTLRKMIDRVWDPQGPVFPPKVFGMGWTLNLARPAAWAFLGGLTAFCVTVAHLAV